VSFLPCLITIDANFVVATSGELALRSDSCDVIFCTAPADLPWDEYLKALKPNGKLCIVGAPPNAMRISAFSLIDGQKGLAGSAVGSIAETRAMLEFSARHNIKPMIERFSMKQVNEALDRLRHNRVRYRTVLVN
jgi:uncharacterized zinc-type alcohol dehydrogenase-like protein